MESVRFIKAEFSIIEFLSNAPIAKYSFYQCSNFETANIRENIETIKYWTLMNAIRLQTSKFQTQYEMIIHTQTFFFQILFHCMGAHQWYFLIINYRICMIGFKIVSLFKNAIQITFGSYNSFQMKKIVRNLLWLKVIEQIF